MFRSIKKIRIITLVALKWYSSLKALCFNHEFYVECYFFWALYCSKLPVIFSNNNKKQSTLQLLYRIYPPIFGISYQTSSYPWAPSTLYTIIKVLKFPLSLAGLFNASPLAPIEHLRWLQLYSKFWISLIARGFLLHYLLISNITRKLIFIAICFQVRYLPITPLCFINLISFDTSITTQWLLKIKH